MNTNPYQQQASDALAEFNEMQRMRYEIGGKGDGEPAFHRDVTIMRSGFGRRLTSVVFDDQGQARYRREGD